MPRSSPTHARAPPYLSEKTSSASPTFGGALSRLYSNCDDEQLAGSSDTSEAPASYTTSVTSSPPTTAAFDGQFDKASPYDEHYDKHEYETGLTHPKHPVDPAASGANLLEDTPHTELGHCTNPNYRYKQYHPKGAPLRRLPKVDPPFYVIFWTYFNYFTLTLLGQLRDFFGRIFARKRYADLRFRDGYAPLTFDYDSFFTRRVKNRMDELFNRPIFNVPGRTIQLLGRRSADYNKTFEFTGEYTRALNVSSYNYLGFAEARGGCADSVDVCLRQYGVSSCGPRLEGGTTDLHQQTEALIANFLGVDDAIVVSMGFATNTTTVPAIVEKGCLVLSDANNHASMRLGIRASGAVVKTYRHNDMKQLEQLLRDAISQGQPKTHKAWKKILVVVEGVYSMEGSIVDLPALVALKKRYKFYLYIDEAHSVGGIGPHGRGLIDYFNVDPKEVDVLMGTFSKSFGAAGGYVAGSKALIDRLRYRSHASSYAESMTPAVLTQIAASIAMIMGVTPAGTPQGEFPSPAPAELVPDWFYLTPTRRDGSEGLERLRRLAFNTRYLSRGLRKLGFVVPGACDSPIVPLVLFNPGKMASLSNCMLERKTPVAITVVGYPATPLESCRVRFSISASHTKEDMDEVLLACEELAAPLDLKHGLPSSKRWSVDEVIERAIELVQAEDIDDL